MADQPETELRCGITAAGYFVLDQIRQINAWPPEEGLAEVLEESAHNGGGPSNLLIDMARMGATFPLRAVGRVGEDEEGRQIAANCRRAGLTIDGLTALPGVPTAVCNVMSCRATGRRTFFFQRGANAYLDEEYLIGKSDDSRLFYLAYPLLLDRLDQVSDGLSGHARVLRAKKKAGQITAMDLVSMDGPLRDVVEPAMPFTDYLFFNDQECCRLTGISVREQGDPLVSAIPAAFNKQHEMGMNGWAILHRPDACWAFHPEHGILEQPCVNLPGEFLKGSNGAGDALAAGVLYAVHEGHDVQTALKWGVCAAAACLHSCSATDGVATMDQCLELGRRFGFRRT
jgi:sugar/nucleoside kinase (ribokinase family)